MSLNLELFGKIDLSGLDLEKIKDVEVPDFAKFEPDFKEVEGLALRYSHYKNLIIIGNGGSITSFWALYKTLGEYRSQKKVYLLSTMDPDLVVYLKESCPKDETLVIPVSKSGNTVGVLEDIFAFEDYQKVAITTEGKGALYQIVKRRGLDYLTIPLPIGGRFSGRTTAGFFPAALVGIDIREVDEEARKMYAICSPAVPLKDNPALRLSVFLYLKDQQGYSEIFFPVYSPQLEGFVNLVVQLIHESSGKEGKGQTIYGSLAPESQHHTNQRFFGGRRNVVGLFLRVANYEHNALATKVPPDLEDIPLKDKDLSLLSGIPLSKAVEFEFLGTKQDAKDQKMPHAILTVDKITPYSIGELLAFFHYLAFYSSLLRGVNPLDQPQVENSKNISFSLRRDYKKGADNGLV